MTLEEGLAKAAQWLREADGLLITAGAGMGVDSGLPDFRGAEGYWRVYPELQRQQLSFEDMPTARRTKLTSLWITHFARQNVRMCVLRTQNRN